MTEYELDEKVVLNMSTPEEQYSQLYGRVMHTVPNPNFYDRRKIVRCVFQDRRSPGGIREQSFYSDDMNLRKAGFIESLWNRSLFGPSIEEIIAKSYPEYLIQE